ncbi:Brain-specific angiogenesis inhibitor 1-associated protein 2-like protein 1, partial [Ophiophagus hannah]
MHNRHVLIEISIAQKKLNDKLEENFKKFHKEIISELEKKTELDVKYMNATLKRYQNEHRSKLDSLEKSQAELKKIRRKSQGGRNTIKYEHRESEVGNNYDSLRRHSPKVPPAPPGRAYTSPLVDMFNNPPVVPKTSSEKLSNAADDSSLSRSTSVATGLNIMKRQKVKTIFPHTAGSNETLLSFAQGDLITLFVSEERDGWLYGEHDVTKVYKPNMNGIVKPPFLSGENPFATVKLRPTVTNDRSAPIFR